METNGKFVGEELEKDPTFLNEPIINKIKSKLPKNKPLSNWWKTMPDWFCNDEITDHGAKIFEELPIWKKRLVMIEEAVQAKKT